MKFKVNYSDSNFVTAKTIEAENHIDAAKKYYQTLTRYIDCEIIVQPKGLRGRSNTQKFLTSELFSKLIKLGQKTNLQPKTTTIEINPDFDRSKLDDVALNVFNNIKNTSLSGYRLLVIIRIGIQDLILKFPHLKLIIIICTYQQL